MTKVVYFLCLCLVFGQVSVVSAAEVMEEDMLLGSSLGGEVNETASSEDKPVENDKIASFVSVITKPLSLFFSADDEVETEEGTKETFLERSTRLAEEGSLEDQMNLAYMYLYGTNGVKADYDLAFKYYSMAAAQNDAIAMNNLGSLYFSGIGTKKSPKKALALFEKAAELGNDDAAVNLAFIYLTGGTKDMARNHKAMKLFQKAATKGNKIARFMLGYAYYRGFVVPQDYAEAFKLVRSVAVDDAKLDEAQVVLADMYISGYGTVQNYQKAISALKGAVAQGNTEAFMILAKVYTDARISMPNKLMAHALYNIAASQNIPQAEEKRDEIGKKMQLQELVQAQEMAQQYQAAPSELTTYVRQTFGTSIRHYIDNNMVKQNAENQ